MKDILQLTSLFQHRLAASPALQTSQTPAFSCPADTYTARALAQIKAQWESTLSVAAHLHAQDLNNLSSLCQQINSLDSTLFTKTAY
ncbi:hypothetical protein [Corynebacterium caspium]|uniref:hypothetical protein n=1 Tax=Corynebacterium caspium TaxID=234828 RepID=UPI0003629166|nr:hypothetical protein [Corynebacterium caspium]WKD58637.1 hypothetical protein CCASP_01055 [Corynebacterium caspium DSM 44850]